MKKRWILTSILTLFLVADVDPEDCKIPGKALQWVADYCMHAVESGDLMDEKVAACLEGNRAYTLVDSCENKKKYKMKLCILSAQRGYYNGSAEACFSDTAFIPATVKDNLADQGESPGAREKEKSGGYRPRSYYFLPLFAGFWMLVSLLISFMSGWRSLRKSYRADFPFVGKKLTMKSARMRWGTNYGAVMTIGAGREGLYLAVIFLFRVGHPPLFIPWTDISTEAGRHLTFFQTVTFTFRKCPEIPVVFSKKLAEQILQMKASA